MDKTKVDDMFMEMLEPKIEEIKTKFSKQQKLEIDEINVLLLKSQYNHINHLDMKLNDVTDTVKNLEIKFVTLENKFESFSNIMENKFETFQERMEKNFEKSQKEIQIMMNKQVVWFISGAGVIIVALKLIDSLFKTTP